jgi:hypothetical protein
MSFSFYVQPQPAALQGVGQAPAPQTPGEGQKPSSTLHGPAGVDVCPGAGAPEPAATGELAAIQQRLREEALLIEAEQPRPAAQETTDAEADTNPTTAREAHSAGKAAAEDGNADDS